MKNQRLIEALSDIDDNCSTIEQRRAFRQLCESLDNNETTVQPKDYYELIGIIDEQIQKNGWECDLNFIDVSKIDTMSYLFSDGDFRSNFKKFNGDISKWDTSNVKDMSGMFYQSKFTGDISQFDVSNVINMQSMFERSKFNGDISKWDVSNVTDMSYIFGYSQFNGDISDWDVSNVTDMTGTFMSSKFNGDISSWNVSNLTTTDSMFEQSKFKGDISDWDVSGITHAENMFFGSRFIGDLSNWSITIAYNQMRDMFGDSALEKKGMLPDWYRKN